MATLLTMIASSMIIASISQYSTPTESAERETESPASQACLPSLKADVESDPRKHMVAVEFRPKDATPGERTVGFTILMRTRDGVPSRYSGLCTLTPGAPPAVRIKTAESFGRF